ncbi:hypothetical protein BC826DRAFT_910499 [Russula brevipes]|nr:hypothetical protein BC826DRAFT_910499 [Russula brevipes]
MFDVLFVYPSPDLLSDVVVTTIADSRIHHLWELAKIQDRSLANHVGAAQCTFYIPPDLSFSPSATLLSRSRNWLRRHRDDGQRVRSGDLIHNVFPRVPPIELVHSFLNSFPTPSVGVSSVTGVDQVVNHNKHNVHAGRPAGNFGPPVSLFNPALGLFDYHLSHIDDGSSFVDLQPSLVHLAHTFMVIAANNDPDESMRRVAIKGILNEIFAASMEALPTGFGIQPDVINSGRTPFFVVELKDETGIEGDASLQAALSYAHIATSPMPSKSSAFFSNFPAVLYDITGNLLEIGVATYTDGPYYNLLFSERLGPDFHIAKKLLRLARAFAATRHVLAALSQFYKTAPPALGSIAHLFPSPLPVPTYTDPVPSLTFTHRLSRLGEAVVLAEDEITRHTDEDEDTATSLQSVDAAPDTLEVVVKFTARYHPDAHHLLATKGLAPVLRACVPVCGDLFMVVMDRVYGEMAWRVSDQGELLPYDVYKDIQDAVTLLHSRNFVFGDLRTPNVMVVTGEPNAQCHGMLIDFDWVGAHGIGRYPASLDDSLPDWVSSGVQRCGIMDKAHDLVMLNKFKDQCHTV